MLPSGFELLGVIEKEVPITDCTAEQCRAAFLQLNERGYDCTHVILLTGDNVDGTNADERVAAHDSASKAPA